MVPGPWCGHWEGTVAEGWPTRRRDDEHGHVGWTQMLTTSGWMASVMPVLHHFLFASTKLNCLMIEDGHMCANNLSRIVKWKWNSQELNHDFLTASPIPNHYTIMPHIYYKQRSHFQRYQYVSNAGQPLLSPYLDHPSTVSFSVWAHCTIIMSSSFRLV